MSLSGNEELHYFKKDVIRKVKEWPFNYTSNDPDEQYVNTVRHSAQSAAITSATFRARYTVLFCTTQCIYTL